MAARSDAWQQYAATREDELRAARELHAKERALEQMRREGEAANLARLRRQGHAPPASGHRRGVTPPKPPSGSVEKSFTSSTANIFASMSTKSPGGAVRSPPPSIANVYPGSPPAGIKFSTGEEIEECITGEQGPSAHELMQQALSEGKPLDMRVLAGVSSTDNKPLVKL